jgi:uncharacterized damage-inducible protein DinB
MNIRPGADEFEGHFGNYIRLVPDGNLVEILETEGRALTELMRGVSEEESKASYAAGKWSVRQVLNHITDTERVMAFRAYWFGRNLGQELPGMDQDVAAEAAGAGSIPLAENLREFEAVRAASIALFRNMPAEAWDRRGVASGNRVTVRAMANVVAGHEMHHRAILRSAYGLGGK